SFLDPSFVALLRRHRVALVVADTAGRWPYREDVTADFVYVRLHGDTELYASGYGDAALDRWAARIRAWANGREPRDAVRIVDRGGGRRQWRDVYCYSDNDAKAHAPFDAQRLAVRLTSRSRRAPRPASRTEPCDPPPARARASRAGDGAATHRRRRA